MPKETFTNEQHVRRYQGVATFVVLLSTGIGLFLYGTQARLPIELPTPVASSTSEVVVEGPLMEPAEPISINLPTVAITADFEEPLGVESSGEIEAPDSYDHVAYYKYGPTPGELGPAVVLGHVDSYQGPAVFFSLGQLKPGDPIEITRADGSVATFAVERLERFPQRDFPTREVYGDLPYAGLRLITCTGIYDHGVLRYSHNLIVFARLVSTASTGD